MKYKKLFLTISLIASLILIGGCSAETIQPVNLSTYALTLADTTTGYEHLMSAPDLEPEERCTTQFCNIEGYSVSMSIGNGSDINSIDQSILRYNLPATTDLLKTVFNETYPELSAWTVEKLVDPGVGDVSAAYRYEVPKEVAPSSIGGYVIIFGVGDIFEVIKTQGKVEYAEVREITEKAAAKI